MGGRVVTRDLAGRPAAPLSATELWLLGGTVGETGPTGSGIVAIFVILENRRSST
jgi:hypothetical protein